MSSGGDGPSKVPGVVREEKVRLVENCLPLAVKCRKPGQLFLFRPYREQEPPLSGDQLHTVADRTVEDCI